MEKGDNYGAAGEFSRPFLTEKFLVKDCQRWYTLERWLWTWRSGGFVPAFILPQS